ncbi:putative threonine dehydratase [alpha proteobacterium BAL199]|jgi:threonine dehydratase|nr:putative threonine dehydratase [alpha proteobacterium BAL199]
MNRGADFPLTIDDVDRAAERLRDIVFRTPLLENADVNAALGGRLLIKAECAQRTGAFKIRGAYNCIHQLTEAERTRGVITYSSGNHALGVALAARLLHSSAVIVMPSDVPAAKREAVQALGAQIITFDRDTENSDAVVATQSEETGRLVVPPSADSRVLAGAGTVALEMVAQSAGLGTVIDSVLVPCGGGGLTASTAVVMQALSPRTRVYAAEPALFDDTSRSLQAGERVANPTGRRTICDAIMTPIPNALTFPINLALLAGGHVADDEEVRTAMRYAYENFKIVVEPGAAVGLAAVLSGRIDIRDQTVATVITGGNVDAERFCRLLNDH